MFSARLAALVVATALVTSTALVPVAAPADAVTTVTTTLSGRALLADGSAASRVEVLAADARRPLRDPAELVVATAAVARSGAFSVIARTADTRGLFLRITTTSADHVTMLVGRARTHGPAYPLLDPIPAGGTVAVGTHSLVERGAVTVTVDAPVSCVSLVLMNDVPLRTSCGSRDSKSWRFDRLAPGRYRVVVGWEFGLAEAGRVDVRVRPGRTTSAGVAVGRRTGIAGTITGPDGRPAAGIGVLAVGAADGTLVDGTTDALGRYFLLGLPPGGWRLLVNSREAGRTQESWSAVERDVAVRAGAVEHVDVPLGVGGRIAVTVQSVAGEAVAMAVHDAAGRFRTRAASTATSLSTRLSVDHLEPGTYSVIATSQGRYVERAAIRVRDGETTWTGPLTPSAPTVRVEGRVDGVADDEWVTLRARRTTDVHGRDAIHLFAEPGGAFVLDGLVPGSYEVDVWTRRAGLGWGYPHPVQVDAVSGTPWTLPALVPVERERVYARTTVLWRGRPAPDVFVDDGHFSGFALRCSGTTDAAGTTTLGWDGRVVGRISARTRAIPAPLFLTVGSPGVVDDVGDLTQIVLSGVTGA
jgi:hypothetical protein